jgi:hypothetical protein
MTATMTTSETRDLDFQGDSHDAYRCACPGFLGREALETLSRVPDRRHQVKVLCVAGFSYDEIGTMLGLSYTAVNRLATEANLVAAPSGRCSSARGVTDRVPRCSSADAPPVAVPEGRAGVAPLAHAGPAR